MFYQGLISSCNSSMCNAVVDRICVEKTVLGNPRRQRKAPQRVFGNHIQIHILYRNHSEYLNEKLIQQESALQLGPDISSRKSGEEDNFVKNNTDCKSKTRTSATSNKPFLSEFQMSVPATQLWPKAIFIPEHRHIIYPL